MSVVSSRDVGAKRELLEHRLQQWRDQKLFVDRLYQVCNNVHPGLALDPEAVDHIQMLLMRILFEMLECRPQKVEDVERCMRNALPASMCHWVTKFQGTNEELHNHTSRKGHDKKSRNAKSLAALTHLLHCDMKEHLGYKVDEKVVLSILSVIDYVAADILKWTGNYVKNIRQGDRTIGLQNLKIALNADKSLIELTDMLWNEKDDCGSDGIICSCSDDSQFHTDELTYERVCRDFKHDEEEYLRDLIFVINVFRRKLEDAFMENDENHISDIFGNVTEIHELTCKVKRILEDAIEMWDTPCIGAGLWDLSEAHEFDVYISYMELFQEPPTDVIRKLLEDPNYINFFKHEDSACGGDANCETFRLAVKYVLPNLLYSPVIHFFRYLEYVNLLLRFRPNEDDFEDLLSAKSYLSGISVKVENLCPPALKLIIKRDQLARTSFESQPSYQIKKTDEIQKSIDFWEGREIAYTCTTLIKEGDLQMVRPTLSAASVINETIRKTRGVTDRHVFLFDHLLLLVKAYRNSKAEKPIYKFKAKIPIRKAVIHDLRDTDELQHAFSIEIRSPDSHGILSSYTLFCKSLEDKDSWMTAVVTIQTRSLLDRVLDGWIKEEQKRTPLILPGIDLYRFNMPDNENNIVFEDYPSSRGVPVIRQGTLTKLIERLTYHQYCDSVYVQTFLNTFRSFCTTNELLDLLILRFNVPTPRELLCSERNLSAIQSEVFLDTYDRDQSFSFDQSSTLPWTDLDACYQRFRKEYLIPVQRGVLNVIRHWVHDHWYDFDSDPDLLLKVNEFLSMKDCDGRVIKQHRIWCKNIQKLIKRRQFPVQSGPSRNEPDVNYPPVLWHSAKPGDVESYDFLTLHPIEIGRQLTLLEFDLYRAIKPIELVGAAWTKKDKEKMSPQLLKLTEHSTMLTFYLARSIVETRSLEERIVLFSRIIEVMCVFEELNNFTGIVALFAALELSSVHRLNACWERLDREKHSLYLNFKKLCDPHWKEMISRLKNVNPPCVPFFGHYLSKIFFRDEAFVQKDDDPDVPRDQNNSFSSPVSSPRSKMISFVKCRRISSIITEIQLYQDKPYDLQVEPSIRHFFENLNPLRGFTNKDLFQTYLWEQSLKVEPKDSEKIENVKPSRPAHVLKSPGIKPPKSTHSPGLSSPSSSHLPSVRCNGPTVSTNNTYTVNNDIEISPLRSGSRTSNEDCNSHLGMVEINPGHQPRYLGDARRGHPPPTLPLQPPPLIPRQKKDKAFSTPPSPLALKSLNFSTSSGTSSGPPPLYPRLTSPQRSAGPIPYLRPFSDVTGSESTSPRTPPYSAASTERASSFVFPSTYEDDASSGIAVDHCGSMPWTAVSTPPIVPPRKRRETLPSPISQDALNIALKGVSLSSNPPQASTSSLGNRDNNEEHPKLYPRNAYRLEPAPPRPPKTFSQGNDHLRNSSSFEETEMNFSTFPSGGCPTPPPLPPKTYKQRRQQ